MSNSIWKTPDQKPEDYENIAFYVDGYLFTACYKSQYNQYGIFGASKVEKWCYMKELSSYVLALETELEHTRKAVGRAERLQKIAERQNDILQDHFATLGYSTGKVVMDMCDEINNG